MMCPVAKKCLNASLFLYLPQPKSPQTMQIHISSLVEQILHFIWLLQLLLTIKQF